MTVFCRQLAAFHQAFPTRKTDWEKLTKQEMEARSASHPTVWSRIQALGLEEFPVLSFPADGEYLQEQKKVLEDMDARIAEFTRMNFEEDHRTQYLEPKQKVEQWRSAGSPVVAEEYADIVDALHWGAAARPSLCATVPLRRFSPLPLPMPTSSVAAGGCAGTMQAACKICIPPSR